MKNNLKINVAYILILVFVLSAVTRCKKKDDETTTDITKPAAPSVYTDTVSYVSQTWATLNSLIGAGNLMTTISFEWDTTSNYEHTAAANPDTLSGHTTTKRITEITGLIPNTSYHYRVKAVNSMGTSYGNDKTFTTLPVYVKDIVFNPDLTYGEVTDIDGNTYKTIQIGTQVWMAENLATTRLYDGTNISLATNSTVWTGSSEPSYSWYNNVTVLYGALYNWTAVNSGKLCPTGWHVSSDDEWTALSTLLGGLTVAGSILKETGTKHWLSPNSGATNLTGFTAIPGGYRYYSGAFNAMNRYGYWWTSTESTTVNAFARSMFYGYTNLDRISSDKRSGASVRCIKD
jgi:uncharacterized protein (TIGR02145 family)